MWFDAPSLIPDPSPLTPDPSPGGRGEICGASSLNARSHRIQIEKGDLCCKCVDTHLQELNEVATPTAIRDLLGDLKDQSLAAHREIANVLPAIEPHGADVTLAWLNACRTLFEFDREAGKAFIRGSAEAEKVSETVLPWTEQALEFTRWRGSWRALEGFMANLPRAFGSLGHAGERRWAEIGFVWCGRQIDSGAAYFTKSVYVMCVV